jgi:peptidoglycan/xylan/chitin deacetylase (PgdA/CDA1 family)
VRFLGGFALAQYLTRKRLRILCYHGFSLGDEHELMPHVFMRRETFVRRMQILKRRGLPIISLNEAVQRLKSGEVRSAETVITFDDGWASNLTLGAPILEKFAYPACVYVTTEHLAAGAEVFNVALYYMLCHASVRSFDLKGLHPLIDGSYQLGEDPAAAQQALIEAAEQAFPDLCARQRLLRAIAEALGIDLDSTLAGDRFRLLRRSEIQALHSRGWDIQLHTHTHRLPDQSYDLMSREITENRRALEAILGTIQNHLCYPSGRYAPQHLEWLAKLEVESATTCDAGLNGASAHLLRLRRYLDSDQQSDIVFEAQVCGLHDLAREVQDTLRRIRRQFA